jgi:hypothetical protein
MNKRLLKVAVTTALAASIAVPAFANPFSDVPAKHWSYDAVTKLAQAGVVEGYGDGTFRGDKTVTRYEMAQIVANAMTKSLNADQKATVEKLEKEFATELNTLGVKVEGMQDQIDNMVKISGDARVRFASEDNATDQTDLRARVNFDGKVSDDIRFNARLSGKYDFRAADQDVAVKLDTANVTFNALGLENTVGRQDVLMGSGIIIDDTMTGLATKAGNLKVYAGNNLNAERMYGAEYGFNVLGAKVTADYLKNGDEKLYGANASFGVAKGIDANVDYVKNDSSSATATAYGVKFKNVGLSATYRDVEAGVYNAYSGKDLIALPTDQDFKGMEYQYDKALTKNTDLKIKYQDFDNMNARTAATVNVKF